MKAILCLLWLFYRRKHFSYREVLASEITPYPWDQGIQTLSIRSIYRLIGSSDFGVYTTILESTFGVYVDSKTRVGDTKKLPISSDLECGPSWTKLGYLIGPDVFQAAFWSLQVPCVISCQLIKHLLEQNHLVLVMFSLNCRFLSGSLESTTSFGGIREWFGILCHVSKHLLRQIYTISNIFKNNILTILRDPISEN